MLAGDYRRILQGFPGDSRACHARDEACVGQRFFSEGLADQPRIWRTGWPLDQGGCPAAILS